MTTVASTKKSGNSIHNKKKKKMYKSNLNERSCKTICRKNPQQLLLQNKQLKNFSIVENRKNKKYINCKNYNINYDSKSKSKKIKLNQESNFQCNCYENPFRWQRIWRRSSQQRKTMLNRSSRFFFNQFMMSTATPSVVPTSIMNSKFYNKSNKLLITIILLLPLLITTMTAAICPSNESDIETIKTTIFYTTSTTIITLVPEFVILTIFLKFKMVSKSFATFTIMATLATLIGATTNQQQQHPLQQQEQPQRQLFAMLTKNGQKSIVSSIDSGRGDDGGGRDISRVNGFLRNGPSGRRNYNGFVDNDSKKRNTNETSSLETIGFVSDDGDLRYEKAEKALAAAAAATAAFGNRSQNNQINTNNNNNNVNCPKECKCLNDFFDCHKKFLDRVPTLPNYVQNLDLSFNNLNDTTILQIKNLPDLKRLHLKRNQLDAMPIFLGLTNLKQLNLANNRIQQISSEALSVLPKLKSLNLSRNFLHTLGSNHFPESNRLAHLIFNDNKIANIDEQSFENLPNLIDLSLNSNRLVTLPAGLFKSLKKLEKLSLNNNNLEINWSTFKGLISLQKLSLQSNNIRALQDGVFHVMRSIEIIELDNNDITSLSRQGLFNLTKLHKLSLSNNSISRIEPDTWEFTQSLVHLDLSYNNISEFKPQHLDCLQHLTVLSLAHNKIDFFADNTFDCVKNLEELNLKRNKLAWIIEDVGAMPLFKSLRKLRTLDLSSNNLKQISSKTLLGLGNLEQLNLDNNALASIQNGAFDHMTNLQKVKFKSMNFICDCDLRGFQRWLQVRVKSSPQLKKNAICGYPELMLDRELLSLTQDELICADSPKPLILIEPRNQLAVKGANVTMECVAKSTTAAALAAADELKIKWRHDNQNLRERHGGQSPTSTPAGPPQLHNHHHNPQHHHGHHANSYSYSLTETQIHTDSTTNQTIVSYLRLFNVSYENAGRYQCVVSNAFGTTYSQKFKLSIGIHPMFLQVPSNLTIDSGDTARLVCSATGDPMPEIALQKFGASDFPAAIERRLQVIREENAFIITNAKPIDTGIYTCTAESAAGEIKINASLIVNDKPQPSIPVIRQEAVLGSSALIKCLNGLNDWDVEHPRREWFKDNKPFHATTTKGQGQYLFTVEREVLVIISAQSTDAGSYRCELTDDSKTYVQLTELIVVQEDFSYMLILIGIIAFVCLIVIIVIIWIAVAYQRRKSYIQNVGVTLSGSRGSILDQTQLTTLNRTCLRPQNESNVRPRSLAGLQMNGGLHLSNADIDAEQINCLIVASTPSYEQQIQMRIPHATTQSRHYGNAVDTYLRRNSLYDAEHQQDHLSSKDSGTGSDAAAKRSLDDFTIALLPMSSSIDAPLTISGSRRNGEQNIFGTAVEVSNSCLVHDLENDVETPRVSDSEPESVATSLVLGLSEAVEMREYIRNGQQSTSVGTPTTGIYVNSSGCHTPIITTTVQHIIPTSTSVDEHENTVGDIAPTINTSNSKCKTTDIRTSFKANAVVSQAIDI